MQNIFYGYFHATQRLTARTKLQFTTKVCYKVNFSCEINNQNVKARMKSN